VTAPLLVAVAHGLDLLTFMWAVSILGIGGESNGLIRQAHGAGGLLLIVALKTAGLIALACIASMRRWALLPAAGAGIAGASVNLVALSL
jgi:hypothetical protein